MPAEYNDLQIDAIREVMNTGSGSAAADLGVMVNRSVDIDVPKVLLVDIAEAVELLGGNSDEPFTVVGVPLEGDVDGMVTMVLQAEAAQQVCGWMGCPPSGEYNDSALQEVGNTMASSYTNTLAEMAGMSVEMGTPHLATDTLPALLPAITASVDPEHGRVLLIDSELEIAGENCRLWILLVANDASLGDLLGRLGLAA